MSYKVGDIITEFTTSDLPAGTILQGISGLSVITSRGLVYKNGMLSNFSPEHRWSLYFTIVWMPPQVGDELSTKEMANLPVGSVVFNYFGPGWCKLENGWASPTNGVINPFGLRGPRKLLFIP